MDKKKIFDHYSEIIDELIDSTNFFKIYFQAPYSFEEGIEVGEVLFRSGATRTCIIDPNFQYVVKFDIDEDYLGYACEREKQIYDDACAEHLEKYFCEVIYLGTYTREIYTYPPYKVEQNMSWYGYDESFEKEFEKLEDEEAFGEKININISIPLYAYRFADKYNKCAIPSVARAYSVAARSIASPLRSNLCVATAFINEYGMDEYARFSAFGIIHEINDVHLNNIGSIDGNLCLIDYAGYHSFDDYDEEGNYCGPDEYNS